MLQPDILTTFYQSLDETKRDLTAAIDRAINKIDDVATRMATHRDLQDIKERQGRAETALDRLTTEMAKRVDVDAIVANLHVQISAQGRKIDEQAQQISKLEQSAGRLPAWFWPTIIAAAVTIAVTFARVKA